MGVAQNFRTVFTHPGVGEHRSSSAPAEEKIFTGCFLVFTEYVFGRFAMRRRLGTGLDWTKYTARRGKNGQSVQLYLTINDVEVAN